MSLLGRARRAARLFGLEVVRGGKLVSPEQRLLKQLSVNQIETVLDIGANTGQFAVQLFDHGFKGKVISFEPLPDAHKELSERASNYSVFKGRNWKVEPRCALGAAQSEADFFVAGNSQSSSLLDMTQAHINAAPSSALATKIKVPVIRLDTFIEKAKIDVTSTFMKIDVQGGERDVLSGLGNYLEQVRGMQVEMSTATLYKGQSLDLDIRSSLEKKGMAIWDIIPMFTDPATGKMLQYDAVFFRE